MNRYQQKGLALISALLLMALAASVAMAMLSRQNLEVRRHGGLMNYDQATQYAWGAEAFAIDVLREDIKDNKIDSLDEGWAQTTPGFAIDGGHLQGRMFDMQGRFNLNNLVLDEQASEPDLAQFRCLLESLDINPDLADAVVDWIDPDVDIRFPLGAEDDGYLLLDPPYRAANAPMSHASELRLVTGFGNKEWQALEPWITALPVRTPLNVNTIGLPLMQCLAADIAKSHAEELLQMREDQPFEALTDFVNQARTLTGKPLKEFDGIGIGANPDSDTTSLALSSKYFLLISEIRVDRTLIRVNSLLERKSSSTLQVISRDLGL